jgi:hypothetical protein
VGRPARRPGAAVALALGIGLVVVTATALVTTHFNAARPHYNVWMRPGFCILLSAAVASGSRAVRHVAAGAFGLLVVAQACGAYQLAAHGDAFAHGAHRAIIEEIRAQDASDLAMVLDDPTYRAMLVYHPIRYELGPGLEHYQRVDTPGGAALVREFPSARGLCPVTALPHRCLVVVALKVNVPATRPAEGGSRDTGDGPIARALQASGDWRIVSERRVVPSVTGSAPFYVWAIDVFERRWLPGEDVQRLARLPAEKASRSESR